MRVGRRDGVRRALLRHRLEVLPHLRRERQCACTLPPPPAPSRQAPARFAFNLQGKLPQPPPDATPAPYNDAKVANRNCGGFGWEMAHAAVSLDRIVARAEGYTFAATVWDLSIVEGPFSAAPCHNPSITLRFAPSRLRCAPPLCSHHEGQAGHSLQLPTRIVATRVQGGTLVPVYHANQSSIGLRIQLRQAHVLTAGVRDSASTWAKTRPSAADVRAVGWVGETGEAPHRLDTVTHATLRCVVF